MLNQYLDSLHRLSGKLQEKIDSAVENNQKRGQLMEMYYTQGRKFGVLNAYYDKLFQMRKMVMTIMDARRDSILYNLERRVESILAVVLPEENFKIKITYTPNRGNYNSEVFVGKETAAGQVIWTRPKGTNGEFMKQLISFSILASINILLQSNFLFMDEPFSSSDTVNVSKLRPVFELMLEQGLQLMFIEHKKELYNGLDHQLIRLYKHRSATSEHDGHVEVLSVERISGNEEAQAIPDAGGTDLLSH